MTMHPNEIALNEYADEALPEAERAGIAEHLQGCDECRRTVDAIRALKDASAALPPLSPPDGAWEKVRRRVARERTGAAPAAGAASAGGSQAAAAPGPADASRTASWSRQRVPSWWKGLAAAAAIVIAVGGGWYYAARGGRATPPPATAAATATPAPPDAQAVAAELQQAEQHYQKAIAGLEQIATSEKGALDPQTAATIENNLTVVDQAIGESRAALRQQPTSEPAQQSLLENFRTKLALLEDTVALINEMRKGDEAGTARIASSLKQKG